jgi:hypothetical protein
MDYKLQTVDVLPQLEVSFNLHFHSFFFFLMGESFILPTPLKCCNGILIWAYKKNFVVITFRMKGLVFIFEFYNFFAINRWGH